MNSLYAYGVKRVQAEGAHSASPFTPFALFLSLPLSLSPSFSLSLYLSLSLSLSLSLPLSLSPSFSLSLSLSLSPSLSLPLSLSLSRSLSLFLSLLLSLSLGSLGGEGLIRIMVQKREMVSNVPHSSIRKHVVQLSHKRPSPVGGQRCLLLATALSVMRVNNSS